jgi:hypothetical protein
MNSITTQSLEGKERTKTQEENGSPVQDCLGEFATRLMAPRWTDIRVTVIQKLLNSYGPISVNRAAIPFKRP